MLEGESGVEEREGGREATRAPSRASCDHFMRGHTTKKTTPRGHHRQMSSFGHVWWVTAPSR